MEPLKGANIYLRALEQEDLSFLYNVENSTAIWEISGTTTPYSKDVLQLYLDNAYRDIYDVKQLRLVICNNHNKAIGLIDLFDFDPQHKRAGVGIVILEEIARELGYGSEALEVLCNYAFNILDLKQLYANILESNTIGVHVFKKLGFKIIGVKEDWIFHAGQFKNEVLLQKVRNICI